MSDKKQSSPKPEGGLLFVNKNAQSSSFSKAATREEAAAINSYAQKWFLEKSSKKSTKSASPSTTAEPAKTRPLKAYVSKVRVNQLTDDGPKPTRRRRKPSKKVGEEIEAETLYDPARQTPPSKREYAYSIPTPSETEKSESQSPPLTIVHHTPGSSVDAFSRASLPMNCDVVPVLQYYINFTLMATFNANTTATLSPTQLAHSSAIESIITGSIGNKAHMYALLSATASRMRSVSNVPLTSTRRPEFFLGKAIEAMRSSLATQTMLSDKQMILDIFYLSVCEWYMHSYDAARTHFGFLRHFWKDIDPQKGVLDKYIHDMVGYNDVFLAVETGQPPFLDMKWKLEPLSEDRMAIVRQALAPPAQQVPSPHASPVTKVANLNYGSGFSSVVQSDVLGHDLRQVLGSLPELMQIYHFTLQTSESCETESSYLSRKSQSLLHRLTSLHTSGHELCISLSLIILLSCMSTSAAWRAGKVDMVRLANRLSRQLEDELLYDLSSTHISEPTKALWTGQDNRMLLWILLTGLFAAGRAPEAGWFGLRATALLKLLQTDREEVESLMHSFVYLPGLQTSGIQDWSCDTFS